MLTKKTTPGAKTARACRNIKMSVVALEAQVTNQQSFNFLSPDARHESVSSSKNVKHRKTYPQRRQNFQIGAYRYQRNRIKPKRNIVTQTFEDRNYATNELSAMDSVSATKEVVSSAKKLKLSKENISTGQEMKTKSQSGNNAHSFQSLQKRRHFVKRDFFDCEIPDMLDIDGKMFMSFATRSGFDAHIRRNSIPEKLLDTEVNSELFEASETCIEAKQLWDHKKHFFRKYFLKDLKPLGLNLLRKRKQNYMYKYCRSKHATTYLKTDVPTELCTEKSSIMEGKLITDEYYNYLRKVQTSNDETAVEHCHRHQWDTTSPVKDNSTRDINRHHLDLLYEPVIMTHDMSLYATSALLVKTSQNCHGGAMSKAKGILEDTSKCEVIAKENEDNAKGELRKETTRENNITDSNIRLTLDLRKTSNIELPASVGSKKSHMIEIYMEETKTKRGHKSLKLKKVAPIRDKMDASSKSSSKGTIQLSSTQCDKPGCLYGCVCHLCEIKDSVERDDASDFRPIASRLCSKEYCKLGCICSDNDVDVQSSNLDCMESAIDSDGDVTMLSHSEVVRDSVTVTASENDGETQKISTDVPDPIVTEKKPDKVTDRVDISQGVETAATDLAEPSEEIEPIVIEPISEEMSDEIYNKTSDDASASLSLSPCSTTVPHVATSSASVVSVVSHATESSTPSTTDKSLLAKSIIATSLSSALPHGANTITRLSTGGQVKANNIIPLAIAYRYSNFVFFDEGCDKNNPKMCFLLNIQSTVEVKHIHLDIAAWMHQNILKGSLENPKTVMYNKYVIHFLSKDKSKANVPIAINHLVHNKLCSPLKITVTAIQGIEQELPARKQKKKKQMVVLQRKATAGKEVKPRLLEITADCNWSEVRSDLLSKMANLTKYSMYPIYVCLVLGSYFVETLPEGKKHTPIPHIMQSVLKKKSMISIKLHVTNLCNVKTDHLKEVSFTPAQSPTQSRSLLNKSVRTVRPVAPKITSKTSVIHTVPSLPNLKTSTQNNVVCIQTKGNYQVLASKMQANHTAVTLSNQKTVFVSGVAPNSNRMSSSLLGVGKYNISPHTSQLDGRGSQKRLPVVNISTGVIRAPSDTNVINIEPIADFDHTKDISMYGVPGLVPTIVDDTARNEISEEGIHSGISKGLADSSKKFSSVIGESCKETDMLTERGHQQESSELITDNILGQSNKCINESLQDNTTSGLPTVSDARDVACDTIRNNTSKSNKNSTSQMTQSDSEQTNSQEAASDVMDQQNNDVLVSSKGTVLDSVASMSHCKSTCADDSNKHAEHSYSSSSIVGRRNRQETHMQCTGNMQTRSIVKRKTTQPYCKKSKLIESDEIAKDKRLSQSSCHRTGQKHVVKKHTSSGDLDSEVEDKSAVHNKREQQRRLEMKNSITELQRSLGVEAPLMSKIAVLQRAKMYINNLHEQEKALLKTKAVLLRTNSMLLAKYQYLKAHENSKDKEASTSQHTVKGNTSSAVQSDNVDAQSSSKAVIIDDDDDDDDDDNNDDDDDGNDESDADNVEYEDDEDDEDYNVDDDDGDYDDDV